MNKQILALGLALASIFVVSTANAALIDDFSSGNLALPGINATGPGDIGVSIQTGGMRGGTREISVENLSGDGTSTVIVADSVLEISNGSNEQSNVTVSWSFVAADFTDGGFSTGILLSLMSPLDNIMDIVFNVSDGGNTSSFTTAYPDGASGNDFFLAYADFVGSADITAVASASIEISSPNVGFDVQINSIETRPAPLVSVPEPSVILLLGAGLLGFSASSMRSKKQS